jgi:hypothetical protein
MLDELQEVKFLVKRKIENHWGWGIWLSVAMNEKISEIERNWQDDVT